MIKASNPPEYESSRNFQIWEKMMSYLQISWQVWAGMRYKITAVVFIFQMKLDNYIESKISIKNKSNNNGFNAAAHNCLLQPFCQGFQALFLVKWLWLGFLAISGHGTGHDALTAVWLQFQQKYFLHWQFDTNNWILPKL